jgi:hypothetical protein
MKRSVLLSVSILVFFILSCSGFNVKKEFSEGRRLSSLKKSGIIIHMWKSSMVRRQEIEENLTYWLNGCKRLNETPIIAGALPSLYTYNSDTDRFLQTTGDGSFLSYKSMGLIRTYINTHRDELKKTMTEGGLDSVIFYEIDGNYSSELEYIDFNSMVVIIDADLNILYLDHQSRGFDTDEWDRNIVRKTLFNKLSERFLETMESLEYIEKD